MAPVKAPFCVIGIESMKLRVRRKGFVNRYIPGKDCKHCELCFGEKGGVRGNNNIINGVAVCDYCRTYIGGGLIYTLAPKEGHQA